MATLSFHEEMRLRQAVLPISNMLMERVFRLPEGYEVQGVGVLPSHAAFGVVVRSPAFAPVPQGVLLPMMGINYTTCRQCGGSQLEEVVYPADPLRSLNIEIL